MLNLEAKVFGDKTSEIGSYGGLKTRISYRLNVIHQKLSKFLVIRYIGYLLPFSPFRGIIWRVLDKNSRSYLDVGCAKGGTGLVLRMHGCKAFVVGADLYLPYLEELKSKKIYDGLVYCDARHLPFKEKSFDVVLAIEVIEHLSKDEGLNFLKKAEEIASRQVVITTPVGFMKMFHKNLKPIENELQEHKSGWLPEEFKELGYRVRGEYGPSFLPRDMAYWLSFILPLTYFIPTMSYCMICTKRRKDK